MAVAGVSRRRHPEATQHLVLSGNLMPLTRQIAQLPSSELKWTLQLQTLLFTASCTEVHICKFLLISYS